MPKIKIKAKADGADKIYLNNALKPLVDGAYDLKSVIPIKVAFHALPLRSYSDYYKIILKPQSLHKIQQLVKGNRYSNAQEFVVDMTQISWNLRYYNEKGSDYYETAVVLDNYIKEVVIPTLQGDPKVFGGDKVGYPYLGPLPGEDEVNAGGNAGANADANARGDANINASVNADINANININANANPSVIANPSASVNPSAIVNLSAFANPSTPLKEPSPFNVNRQETEEEKAMAAMYHAAEALLLHEPQESFDPVPEFSTLGIPPEVFQDYVPIPVEEVPTLDQNTAMVPKPSPIVLNTTTLLPPHPNQREVFETWNKRGKPPVIDKPHEQRTKNIMRYMKKERGSSGELLYLRFERLPNQSELPDYYRKITNPMCLEQIRTKIKQRKYHGVENFLNDLFLVIENAKLYAGSVSDTKLLNDLVEFDQICRRLTAEELQKPDSAYLTSDLHGMRVPIDVLDHGGRKYKIGDWVLLRNPNDETKPIPLQIFRIWITPENGNKRYINVCWYYRPEQTVHRVDRLFYENEVFKTGQYRDHLAQDILGPCYVNYFTRYQRGEPLFKVYGPMFICEFRYSDHDKNFNKIRTWKLCIPDEVREIDDPIIPLPNGGLRWFQKYTSPLMHLLPPGASISDPMPEPIIASMNAPPLIGGVYKRGPLLDDDLGQYLSSPARNLVVRKTITNLNNIGTRNDLPMPLLKTLNQQQQQQNAALQLNTSLDGHSSGSFNYSSPLSPPPSALAAAAQLQAHLLAQMLMLQHHNSRHTLPPHAPLHSPLQFQDTAYHAPLQGANSTHYTNLYNTRVVPSPFNQVNHVFSNYFQTTNSPVFILPTKLSQKLGANDGILSHQMDLANKQRLLRQSPSFLVSELQNFDLMNKLKDPVKRKLGADEDEYDENDEDELEEEEEPAYEEENPPKRKRGRPRLYERRSVTPTYTHVKREKPVVIETIDKTPSLWFRGAPLHIQHRILNTWEGQVGNSHILRYAGVKGETGGAETVKPGETGATEAKTGATENGEEKSEIVDSEIVETDVKEEEEEEEDLNEQVKTIPGFSRFGPSVEYLAFKLKSLQEAK